MEYVSPIKNLLWPVYNSRFNFARISFEKYKTLQLLEYAEYLDEAECAAKLRVFADYMLLNLKDHINDDQEDDDNNEDRKTHV